MNRLLSFERRDSDVGGSGQPVDSWQVFTKAWASIQPISGREYFAASGERALLTHKIRVRYGPTVIKAKDRAREGTRVFDIKSVLNDNERNQFLTMMVTERV